MKIYIYSKLKEGAWGGGNQFLKAMREEFMKRDLYTENIKNSNVLIFNSYQDSLGLIKSIFKYNNKKIIYRLGPVFSLHRKGIKWKLIDVFVVLIANFFADLVIFQSKWSYEQALKLGFSKKKKYNIILNAVDDSIFYKKTIEKNRQILPIRLVYTSWSSNINKGFKYLKFLDNNLDFNKFKMKFIGNSPITFKNIEIIKPLRSMELAKELRKSDIFISPTKDDACSNAILEALSCGLPVVALLSGGNSELVMDAGLLFNNEKELLSAINRVGDNLITFQNKIKINSLEKVSSEYIIAIENLCNTIDSNTK